VADVPAHGMSPPGGREEKDLSALEGRPSEAQASGLGEGAIFHVEP